ncbi:hypothetical protein BDA99DRAFT_491970 [Phascolomyces articulosus]|uniref:Uncharacterized protein n=1 Tax=Phascolomyces articulosus TaxID=60185 RepID=A0AAD5KPW3_9FUNG|nr:hypothetical protein BDA99DRAFT_491970 [Phascolomyces articulosus]
MSSFNHLHPIIDIKKHIHHIYPYSIPFINHFSITLSLSFCILLFIYIFSIYQPTYTKTNKKQSHHSFFFLSKLKFIQMLRVDFNMPTDPFASNNSIKRNGTSAGSQQQQQQLNKCTTKDIVKMIPVMNKDLMKKSKSVKRQRKPKVVEEKEGQPLMKRSRSESPRALTFDGLEWEDKELEKLEELVKIHGIRKYRHDINMIFVVQGLPGRSLLACEKQMMKQRLLDKKDEQETKN